MTMLDKRYKKVVVYVGLVVLLSSISCSPKPVRTTPKIMGDPEAIKIIEKMKENGKDLKSFKVEATAYREREGKWEKVVTKKTIVKLPHSIRGETYGFAKSIFTSGKKVGVTQGSRVVSYGFKKNSAVIFSGPHLFDIVGGMSLTPENKLFYLYRSLSFVDLHHYFDTHIEVSILSSEEVDGREAYVLKIYPISKRRICWLKMWVDKERYVPLRLQRHEKRPLTKHLSVDVVFKDYKLVANKMWLFQKTEGISQSLGTADVDIKASKVKRYWTVRVEWDKLQINPDIPDSTFKFKIPKGAKVIKTKTR